MGLKDFLSANNVFFAKLLSIHYPLKHETLLFYCYKWDWYELSRSNNVNWDLTLLLKLDQPFKKISNYELNRIWSNISNNESVKWNSEIINNFKDKLNLHAVVRSKNFFLNDEIRNLLDIHLVELANTDNVDLNLNFLEIEKLKAAINSKGNNPKTNNYIEINVKRESWSNEILFGDLEKIKDGLRALKNQLNWESLSESKDFPWTKEIIEEFKDYWDWQALSANTKLPWTDAFIDEYADKLWFNDESQKEWPKCLSTNSGVNWNEYLLEKYSDRISWYHISMRVAFSFEMIKKFERKIWFNMLASNHNIPWTKEFIEQHTNMRGFRELSWKLLSQNTSVPWDLEFIEKHENKIDWQAFSINKGKFWTEELINTFSDKLHFKRAQFALDPNLSSNRFLPWSIDLLIKYKDKWDYFELAKNKVVYETIAQNITDEMIDEIISTIPDYKFLKYN